nr:type II toxin-antitoxin system CcdA family antitoxin [Pseudidiomarina tainanensis]
MIKELDDERTEWLRKNKEAIEAYNDRVENKGTFSDSVRKF